MRRALILSQASAQVANVGDIAYKAANGKIKTIALDEWDTSLGTAIGVVVIPSGFAPDNGLARILSLFWVKSSGEATTSTAGLTWGYQKQDTGLLNHQAVMVTNNSSANNSSVGYYGYLPSDNITGTASLADPSANYYNSPYILSPYLGDKPNPAYYSEISGYNNALADFDGKGNTDVLVAFATSYEAPKAARKYKVEGAETIEWYLPATGELGYLFARMKKINASIGILNGSQLETSYYWTSNQYSNAEAVCVFQNCYLYRKPKHSTTLKVRPFAQLDF